jgi:lipoprotein NlpI
MLRLFTAILHFRRGHQCLKQDDFGGALFHFSRVLKVNPRNYFAYHNRGVALQAMGTYASSIEDVDQAIKLQPKSAASHAARGVSRKFLGDFAGAIEDQTCSLALDPKLVAALTELGAACHCSGDIDRALVHLTKAVERAPGDPEAFKLRGYVQFCRGRFEAATADLRHSLELGGDPYAMLFYYLAQSRIAGAASGLELLAANLKGGQWPAPVFELYLGRLSDTELLDAGSTPDERAEAKFYIGEWHLMRGEREAAVSALEAALRSLPPWFVERPAASAELARLT